MAQIRKNFLQVDLCIQLLHPSTSLDNQVVVKDWSVIDFLVSKFLKPLTGFDNQVV